MNLAMSSFLTVMRIISEGIAMGIFLVTMPPILTTAGWHLERQRKEITWSSVALMLSGRV